MDEGRIDLLGCPLDVVDLDGAVARVVSLVERAERVASGTRAQRGTRPQRGAPDTGRPMALALPINAAKLERLAHDPVLRGLARQADLVVADGASILAAARLQGTPLPGRVTGVDLTTALLEVARERRWRVFLLGARPDVVAEAARRTGAAGHHHGYFDDEGEVLDAIRAVRPHLLFVAMGTPRQEHLLARWRDDLDVPFAMGVGGSLDVLAGRIPRAPRWLGDRGLEWAWRLAREPRKRWRRAIVDSARFVARVARRARLPD